MEQVLKKNGLYKTFDVDKCKTMIPQLRKIMRKLTNQRWYRTKTNKETFSLGYEIKRLQDFRIHLENIYVYWML